MSRPQILSVVLKTVLAAVIVGVLVVLATLDNTGCAIDDLFTDLGTVEALCRAPSACYTVGTESCPCARGGSNGAVDPAVLCRVAMVNGQYCDATSHCKLPGTQCVGRAPQTCDGVGARCVPFGSTCAGTSGNPPDRVGTGVNGTLENRCSYVDDVCCPGTIDRDAGTIENDASNPDAG